MEALKRIAKVETEDEHITANIIYNLAHLGISIKDAAFFDIEVYSQIVDLELKTFSKNSNTKQATQKDIDLFLL